jgi:hypothetical protein
VKAWRHRRPADEEFGITRGEVRAIMLALTHVGERLDTIIDYLREDDDDEEEETDPLDS